MLELAVAATRLVQFLAATIIFGAPFFLLYALRDEASPPPLNWSRPLLAVAAGLAALGAAAALMAQTAIMTGSAALALDPESLWAVLSGTQYGRALGVRLAVAGLAGLLAWGLRPSRCAWAAIATLGAIMLGSFAWTGHGAAQAGMAGLIHATADVIHLIAAGVWLGALTVLAILLFTAHRHDATVVFPSLHRALKGFSGLGSLVVAALVASGLVNSWFLVGPDHVLDLFRTTYGVLLLIKLAVFGGMLALAAANRFLFTPGLGGVLAVGASPAEEIRALKRSVATETALGIVVLALVSVLGMLAPPSAQM